MSAIPSDFENVNPLLYTFRDYHTTIQPYFIIVAQFFILEFSLRLWDRVMYDTWLMPSEFISIERDERLSAPRVPYRPQPQPRPRPPPPKPTNVFSISTIHILLKQDQWSVKTKNVKKIPTFDLYDLIIFALPLLAHAIWYCYVQSNCMTGEFATLWRCYNLFGYRIYNYMFTPFTSFSFTFISKCILLYKKRKQPRSRNPPKKLWRRILSGIIFYISFATSILTFVFVGGMVLPFLFTNAIPMAFLYSFMVAIFAYLVSVITVLLKFFAFTARKISGTKQNKSLRSRIGRLRYKPQLVLQAALRLFPHLMSVLFNLSQYFYYGEDYWAAITREANSRDPSSFFSKFNTGDQIGHTVLTTI